MVTSSPNPLQGARVLVLEDEFFLADDLVRTLREKGAEPVGPANSVRQAETLLAREHLDAAILDLNLHGEMASDFVERIAASLPCLIVSGYGNDAVAERIRHLPRVEKPVSPVSVVNSLAAQMDHVDEAPTPPLPSP
jgi:DNA-binding NtrC family response regulator